MVLAPTAREAEEVSTAVSEGGFAVEVVADVAHLCDAVREGAGALALVGASFPPTEVAPLREMLIAEPPRSELPILVFASDVEREQARQQMLHLAELLAPAPVLSFWERPFMHRALVGSLTAALRVRRQHHYEARAHLEQLDLDRRRRELALLAALPIGIVVVDAYGRLIESNTAFQRIWGALPVMQSAADFRLFKMRRTGSDPQAGGFEWRFLRVLATGQPVIDEELEIEAFDGMRRTILSSGLPIRGADGRIEGAVGVQIDITDRARAQRARQILSDATTALFESLDLGETLRTLSRIVVTSLADCCAIDELDEHGQLRRLVAETSGAGSADEAARLLAYAPAVSGNSLAVRVLRSGKPILVSEVPDDWLATGLEADEHRAAFAKIGVYSLMVLPLVARGHPLGVLGIVSTRPDRRYDARDLVLAEEISRRAALALDNAHLHRQANAALRARDDTLAEVESFINAAPVGFALLDRDLTFTRINPVLARFHGLLPDDAIGRPLESVVAPRFEAELAPKIRSVLSTGKAIINEPIAGEMPPDSGKTSHHLDSFVPVLAADGTTRAVGVVVTDVTRLREVEDSLREGAVFRERFIGVLAHDLRSPLHAIVLSAGGLLRLGDAPPVWVRSLGRIAHAAERMDRMVGNLLDLVRSREGGGIPITPKRTDLAVVVRGVVEELEASHPGREIDVSTAGDTFAEIDEDRMAEVVSNLAGNALTYSPVDSAVQVEISGADGELALAVHNAGAPIAPERLRTVFAPFQRGAEPGGGPPAMRGLGLGLFIVSEITRAHGGTVAVSSTAEEGTTFTVRVPRTHATGGCPTAAAGVTR